jgi:TonB family protein
MNAHEEALFVEWDGGDARTARTVRRRAFSAALTIHTVALAALLVWSRAQPVRIGVHDSHQSIGAVVIPSEKPVATSGRSPAPMKPTARRETPAAATHAAPQEQPALQQPQTMAASPGPVRLAPGQHLGLIEKVDPVYPPTLAVAGVEGTVVLDAVIHRDGTVGDLTVIRSTNHAFDQPAIEAVKQWRYTPLPYEGLLTVTVNFTFRR